MTGIWKKVTRQSLQKRMVARKEFPVRAVHSVSHEGAVSDINCPPKMFNVKMRTFVSGRSKPSLEMKSRADYAKLGLGKNFSALAGRLGRALVRAAAV
jgi:hypothetical protein